MKVMVTIDREDAKQLVAREVASRIGHHPPLRFVQAEWSYEGTIELEFTDEPPELPPGDPSGVSHLLKPSAPETEPETGSPESAPGDAAATTDDDNLPF